MSKQQNVFSLRMDTTLTAKLKIIAQKNGRSLNKEIEFVMNQYKDSYEQEHGEIILSQEK